MKNFKSIIILLVLSWLFYPGYAQTYTPNYSEIPNFSQFEGKWVYQTENEHFTLRLKKCQYDFLGTNYIIIGVFRYIKDGKLIYDYLNYFDEITHNSPICHIRMSRMEDLPYTEGHSKVRISFRDPKTVNKTAPWQSVMRIISNNPVQAQWHIEPDMWERDIFYEDENGNIYEINDPILLNGFTIPTDIVLTKVE